MWFVETCRDLFNIIENFCKKYFPYILMTALIAFIGICVYKIFNDSAAIWDEVEHLHASYLISAGHIPYKDFFEHHHLLMWYMLSPIMQLFFGSLNVIYFERFIALLGYFCCFYLIYKINKRFLFGHKAALFATFFLLFIPNVWFEIISIRPDIFMNIFCLLAIYYNLAYLENKRLSALIISYLCMAVSFLFLQKVAVIGVGFALANLWFIYKSEIRWRDFFIASVVASLPILAFMLYLFYNEIFFDYIYYNYTLNMKMANYFHDFSRVSEYNKIILWLCMGCAFYKYKYTPQTFLLLMCSIFAFVSTIKFLPFVQYTHPFLLLVAPFCGYFIADRFSNQKIYIPACLAIIIGLHSLLPLPKNKGLFYNRMQELNFINQNRDICNKFVNFSYLPYNIYTDNADYYWFGYANVVIVDILNNPNIKNYDFIKLLKELKPEYIAYEPLFDDIANYKFRWYAYHNQLLLKRAVMDNGNQEFVKKIHEPLYDFWNIDEKWLIKHYEPTEYEYIWKKKQPKNISSD